MADNELQIIPFGQAVPGHAHRARRAVMTYLAEAVIGQHANQFDVRFVDRSGRVLVRTLVCTPVIRLRMIYSPGGNFVFVDENLTVIQPGIEFRQRLAVVVLADATIEAVVPAVHSTYQVRTVNMAVRHQGATMCAPTVKHADGFVVAHHDEVDIGNQRVCRNAVFQFVPFLDGLLVHPRVLLFVVEFSDWKFFMVGGLFGCASYRKLDSF